jgi:hypothetical protein
MFDLDLCFTAIRTTGVLTQSVAAAATPATNVLDMGADNIRLEGKKQLFLKVLCTEALAGTGTTMTIDLETDTAVGMATACKQVMRIGPIPKARCIAGVMLVNQQLPAQTYQRYWRVRFTGDNTFETTGSLIAWLDDSAEPSVPQLDTI